jgi:hypothetical protein
VNLDNITRDDWIVGGVGILLIIDLLALPWFSVSIGPFTASTTGTGDPDGWLGILAVIAALALVADLGVERFSPSTQLPAIGGGRAMTRFVLAAAAAGLVGLKFLFHLGHFSDLDIGFWVAAVLSGGLVFVTMQARGAAGIATS